MRQAFAHDAVLIMEADGDTRALGAAITAELCGHWEHPPPCPLAPHSTDTQNSGSEVRLRVLFAAEPAAEAEVRDRIVEALSRGRLSGPDGLTTRWEFRGAQASAVRADETIRAARLVQA
jgi:hypothetical protein